MMCPVCDERPVDSTATVLCQACERSWRQARRRGLEDFIWSAQRARQCLMARLAAPPAPAPQPAAAEAPICGARPRGGDGTVWCELAPGHDGLHEGDGMTFSIRAPRQRVTASGALALEAPKRRASALATPTVVLGEGQRTWRCDRRDCLRFAVAILRCHRRGCHADFARCAEHGGVDAVKRAWRIHARLRSHEDAVPRPLAPLEAR